MKCLIVTLLVILNIANAYALTKSATEMENEQWIKLDKLAHVYDLINTGKDKEASMVLDTLSEKYPDYQEVKDVRLNLGAASKNDLANRDRVSQKASNANNLWLKIKEKYEDKHYSQARNLALELMDMYDADEKKPAFMISLKDLRDDLDRKVYENIKEDVEQLRKKLDLSSNKTSEERLVQIVGIYEALSNILARDRDLPMVMEFEKEINSELEQSVRVLLSKAHEINKFNGCSAFKNELTRLLKVIRFKEFDVYRLVYEERETCDS